MDYIKILQIIGGIIFIGWGLLNINPKAYSSWIKLSNEAKGRKTSITPNTLFVGKTMGYGFIFLGVILLIFTFIDY